MIPIPKLIHQIHFGGVPRYLYKFTKEMASLRKHHKDWGYTLWTEKEANELILTKYAKYHNLFESLSIMEKSDFFRYLLMFEFGGVYCDLDVLFHRSIDSFFTDSCVIDRLVRGTNKPSENPTREAFNPQKYSMFLHGENRIIDGSSPVNNFFIMSQPKNDFWIHVIDEIVGRDESYSIYDRTGFVCLTTMLKFHNPIAAVLPPFYFGWSETYKEKRPRWTVASHTSPKNVLMEEEKTGWGFVPVEEPEFTPKNKRLIITVGIGISQDCLAASIDRMMDYSRKVKADFISITNKTQTQGTMEKFRIHHYAGKYERCLFVDSDILISHNAPDIFNVVRRGKIGMFDDTPYLEKIYQDQLRIDEWGDMLKSQNISPRKTEYILNSGVVVFDGKDRDVWLPPKKPLPKHHCIDQQLIQYRVGKRLQLLDRKWNYQWWSDRTLADMKDAYFVHLAGYRNERPESFISTMTLLNNALI